MPYTTEIDPKGREVRDELVRRAERLEARLQELANGAEGVCWPEGTARDTALFYARKLGMLDVEVAAEVLRVLVDESESSTLAFWGTPLGRVLFLLHAHPAEEVDRSMARVLLGLRSRQHVHNLIVAGDLTETMGQTVTSDSIRKLYRVA